MGERTGNLGPKYAIRLSDLRGWHNLTAVCCECRHRKHMRLWELTARHPGYTHLMDLEPKLRCRRCGNRTGNKVYVTLVPRD